MYASLLVRVIYGLINSCIIFQEVVTATIDLEDIRSYRNSKRSHSYLSTTSPSYPRVFVDFSLSPENDTILPVTPPIDWVFLSAEEEIAQVEVQYLYLCFR